jgi:hypothetical protein
MQCGAALARGCASCGAALPGGARFCPGCGASTPASPASLTPRPAPERTPRAYTPKHLADKILASRAALEGERKQVTVLFADVKGSLELAEQTGAEEWHAILDRFFAILTEGVHRFEGTVNQYTGDGIMALFGAPLAHEDHAQRACYAALHLRDALRGLAEELKRTRGVALAARFGLNSGEVVVGKIGDDGIAVLVTLLYLAAQLRQSQREVQRTTAERFLEEAREITLELATSERLLALHTKYGIALGAELPPFVRELMARTGAAPEEAMSLHFLQLAWWLHRERVLEHIDDLPEHDGVYFEGILRRAYATPMAKLWYETHKPNLSQHAVRIVDGLLARPS